MNTAAPELPVITLISYRPSRVQVELGTLVGSCDSALTIENFRWGLENEQLLDEIVKTMLHDHRDKQLANHMFIFRVDGCTPEGQMKYDLNNIMVAAQERVAVKLDEERRLTQKIEQAKTAAAKRQDLTLLNSIISKYSLEELEALGIRLIGPAGSRLLTP